MKGCGGVGSSSYTLPWFLIIIYIFGQSGVDYLKIYVKYIVRWKSSSFLGLA